MNKISNTLSSINPTIFGKFIYYCLPYRKKIVLKNMQQVFADQLSQLEIKKLSQCFYSHLAKSITENIKMRFMSDAAICNSVELIGHENLIAMAENNKGLLILSGHFGNWEFAPIAGIMNFKAFKGRFHFIRKTFRFKIIEKLLFRRYYKAGLSVISKKNALDPVCDALENNDAVIFVMDQHATLESKDGIKVEFFNKPAGTYRSLAMIARYTNSPVVPAAAYRKPDGRHVLHFHEPIPWISHESSHQELLLNTRAYNDVIEKIILAHPEQWLWTHKRWKI